MKNSCIGAIIITALFLSLIGGEGVAQQRPGGSPQQGGPPQEAIDACTGRNEGDPCEFQVPHGMVTGTCRRVQNQLACAPEGGPPSGPPGGQEPGRRPQERRFASSSSEAIEPDMRFVYLTMEDGLSNNHIEVILQDSRGFMWIGTQDGLNRYDGYEFIVYKHEPDNSHSLSHSHVTALLEDTQGMIWVATKGGGVNRLDPTTGVFIRYQSDPDNSNSLGGDTVFSLFQDSTGIFWFGGIPETGLNKYNPTTETFTQYLHDPENPESFPGRGVWKMIEDESGTLWIAAESVLVTFDPQTGRFTPYFPPQGESRLGAILEDAAGKVWVAGTSGIHAFDPETERVIPGIRIEAEVLYEDAQGTFWVGTVNDGLYQFHPHTQKLIHHYTRDQMKAGGLHDDHITALYEDQGRVLWVGTGNGLHLLNPHQTQFAHYQKSSDAPESLSGAGVKSLSGDASGKVWLGTDTELYQLDPTTSQITHYTFSAGDDLGPETTIELVYCDREGFVWIGKGGGILERLDSRTGELQVYHPTGEGQQDGPPVEITSMYEDQTGTLWIGILRAGLFRFDRQTERFYGFRKLPGSEADHQTIGGIHITALSGDRAGNLWIGTEDGVLSRFDPQTETFSHYSHDSKNPQNSISRGRMEAIHEDQTGIVWIASWDGLNRFDPQAGTFTHYTEKDGLPSSLIIGMLEDRAGHLWLSTQKGLSRFDPRTETFRNFSVDDGLQGNEFHRAYWQSPEGQMFFGGANGITAFYPDRISDNPYHPPVILTELRLFNKPVTIGEASLLQHPIWETSHLTLTYDQKILSFEFAALSYATPYKNRYRYMLEGFEDTWNEVDSTRRSVTYTSLPAGDYVFRVRGSNNDGVWSDKEVALGMTVLPPWWETTRFRAVVVWLVIGLFFGGYRWRVAAIKRRNRLLEQQVAERTSELRCTNTQLQQRNQELVLLNQVGQMFNSTIEWNQVLETILQEMTRVLHIAATSFWLRVPETAELICQQATGPKREEVIGLRLPQGQGTVGQAAQIGEIINIGDARTDTHHDKGLDQKIGIEYRSILSIPFRVKGSIIGVLSLVDTEIDRFSDDDLRLVEPITTSAASAIENARLYMLAQEQKEAAEAANRKILESIRYAQIIQNSVLPDIIQVKKHLPESFFLWMPRDIVGGDIFFVEFSENGYIIAVLDCTGHGVPGAFMTMIASSGIRRIVKDEACYDPAAILQRLNVIIKTTLRQDTEHAQSDDGLDAAICFVRPADCLLTFAGAKLPLYYVHHQEVTVIQGDKQSIGYKRSDLHFTFTNHSVPLQEEMSFYLATDGFLDQLGGIKGLPFGKRRFKKLLKEQSAYPFEEQRENLLQAFHAYKGDYERQDDVTVVGFEIQL